MQEGLYGFPKTSDPWSTRLDNELGGLNMDGYSNVVFSNGYLDPWASGGVRSAGWKKGDDSVIKLNEEGNSIALIIEDGAHHLDLFFPNEADPDSVLAAREVEKDMIKMVAQNENKRVFSPGNVDHQIADLALAFHLIYSLSKAKKQLFRSTLRRKETSF